MLDATKWRVRCTGSGRKWATWSMLWTQKTNGIFGRSLVFSTSILAYPNFLTHMITNGKFEFQPIDWTMLSYYIYMADCIRTQILQFLKNQNLM